MSKSMLDHTKNVLKRVSFDASLFCKELEKACKVLLPFELEELVSWLSKFIKEKPELHHCLLLINNK
jgi:DNA replication protein DnaD